MGNKTVNELFPNQIENSWELIGRYSTAMKDGYLLEAISLCYAILEIQLRIMVYNRLCKKHSDKDLAKAIDSKRYLFDLIEMAEENDLLDDEESASLRRFNSNRGKAIHGLARGKVAYSDLESEASALGRLTEVIQKKWIKITTGNPEPTDIRSS